MKEQRRNHILWMKELYTEDLGDIRIRRKDTKTIIALLTKNNMHLD